MNEELLISYSFQPSWKYVEEIRGKTQEFLFERVENKDLHYDTIMCVSELAENAIKYGTEKPDGSPIDFNFFFHDDTIFIQISNGILSKDHLENVQHVIDKIKASDNPGELYIDRLKELMESPHPGESQLGLYRIVYEGGFSLDYTWDEKVLIISAEKSI